MTVTNQITIHITAEQQEWFQNQPHKFNRSKKFREVIDTWIAEDEKNEQKTN